MNKKNIIFCVSGEIGFNTFIQVKDYFNTILLMTNQSSSEIISFAKENEICCFVGNPRNGKVSSFLEQNSISKIDYLISINYLFLIDSDLISFPDKMAINIHGSLLPKYRGRTPHVWAIINGEEKSGLTVHQITEKCDEGDILLQREILIDKDDTGQNILDKLSVMYPQAILDSINTIEKGGYELKKQDSNYATFFGKRTPDDGIINWEWSKERIKNWVRAQARPYPGAFAFVRDVKITFEFCEFSDYGYEYNEPNGLIKKVSDDSLYVKVSNGVLKLSALDSVYKKCRKGDILESKKDE